MRLTLHKGLGGWLRSSRMPLTPLQCCHHPAKGSKLPPSLSQGNSTGDDNKPMGSSHVSRCTRDQFPQQLRRHRDICLCSWCLPLSRSTATGCLGRVVTLLSVILFIGGIFGHHSKAKCRGGEKSYFTELHGYALKTLVHNTRSRVGLGSSHDRACCLTSTGCTEEAS